MYLLNDCENLLLECQKRHDFCSECKCQDYCMQHWDIFCELYSENNIPESSIIVFVNYLKMLEKEGNK